MIGRRGGKGVGAMNQQPDVTATRARATARPSSPYLGVAICIGATILCWILIIELARLAESLIS